MVTFVLVCLAALVVIALIARIMDATGASMSRSTAAERRLRREARFAGGRRVMRRRA